MKGTKHVMFMNACHRFANSKWKQSQIIILRNPAYGGCWATPRTQWRKERAKSEAKACISSSGHGKENWNNDAQVSQRELNDIVQRERTQKSPMKLSGIYEEDADD